MPRKNEAEEPTLDAPIDDTRAWPMSNITAPDPAVSTNTSSAQRGPMAELTVMQSPVSIAGEYPAESTDCLELQHDAVVRRQDATSGAENAMNSRRMLVLQRRFSDSLLALIDEEPFEYGVDGKADALVREQMAVNALATRSWLSRLFLDRFPDTLVAMGILRLVARLDYDDVFPEGPIIAVAALSHRSDSVRECGVRAFESWGDPRNIPTLEAVRVSADWLQDYVVSVIADLRRLECARPGKKNR